MKICFAVMLSVICFWAKAETLVLFYGGATDRNYILSRDYEAGTNKVCHETILADAINFKATNSGSEITFSNVIYFKSLLSEGGIVGKKTENVEEQFSLSVKQITIGFSSQTKLLFNKHLFLLKDVKDEDVSLRFKNKLGMPAKVHAVEPGRLP